MKRPAKLTHADQQGPTHLNQGKQPQQPPPMLPFGQPGRRLPLQPLQLTELQLMEL